MTILTIHTDNKADVKLFEQLAEKLKLKVSKETGYSKDWEEMMIVSEGEAKNGYVTPVGTDELWK